MGLCFYSWCGWFWGYCTPLLVKPQHIKKLVRHNLNAIQSALKKQQAIVAQ